jgi:RsiW-degrading membrane proteinase PrsW (M82 family)
MGKDREPISEAADNDRELYEIANWYERTLLDRVAVSVYNGLRFVSRAVVILLSILLLLTLVALGGLGLLLNRPIVTVLVFFSVAPAFGLAAYVWYADPTTSEPLWLLLATFLIGLLFANFAAVINSLTQPLFVWIPVVGLSLYFYLVVAPIEEFVKLLAVRLYAFNSNSFDSVIDGAVYGAFAGLGFATIENALYVSRGLQTALQGSAGGEIPVLGIVAGTAAVRALAGPGHVIYSAFAGYYLGLAKFNPEDAGPIIVKGLLIAALIHGTYNSLSTVVPNALVAGLSLPPALATLAFIIGYVALFSYLLYRKIVRYQAVYETVGATTQTGDRQL